MTYLAAKIRAGPKPGFELLDQMLDRGFEDVRSYRMYQLSLLESMGRDADFRDIDTILSEDGSHGTSDDLRLIDSMEWKEDQLYRASEKIVEELEAYKNLLGLVKPEKSRKKLHELVDEEGRTLREERYETTRQNFEIIYNGFRKLPEQTDLPYAKPFEKLSRDVAF